jgi:hypothetical protein
MATYFPEGIEIKILGKDVCVLEDDFYFDVIVKGKKHTILIKKGFSFDGASIPRFFWRTIGHPLQYPIVICALPHDGIYAAELFERGECDWIFLTLLQKVKVNWFKRNIIWLAVRGGGYFVFKKHTKESITEAKKYVSIVEPTDI